jgi:hypothetical protein
MLSFNVPTVKDLPNYIQELYRGKLVTASHVYKNEIHEWSRESGATISFVGSLYGEKDVWYVMEDDMRVMFILKWQ